MNLIQYHHGSRRRIIEKSGINITKNPLQNMKLKIIIKKFANKTTENKIN